MTRLIINADDFGIHTSVNQAVIKAFQEGVLTSTSLLANGPCYEEAVRLAKENPGLGIGIHLCLVGSLPPILGIREVPSLVNAEGLFPESYGTVMKKGFLGKIDYRQVYNEWDAQIEKIKQTGLVITHVDSHQHVHMLPPIWNIVQALMKKHDIHRVRIPRESYLFKAFAGNPVRVMGRNGLTWLSEQAMTAVRKWHYTTTDYFWGMVDGGSMTEAHLQYIIKQLPVGIHEIMMHPAMSTDEMKQQFTWGYHWEDELQALLSVRIRNLVTTRKIQLVHYGELL
ncbi:MULTISPECIES: ChbG/HpnK family deacetylase [Megasphaera]|uniref:Hopanoid biosynthesis associated protein HpnK n=1 Tax=Megasphaera hutchinsoni TaxID=1588748 RepID=A0A2J8BAM8_9FIRM|nr:MULTISPECIES: ChbG/HpnK family deacetylase [Megasphaera]EGS32754.1 putative hopanoid biosynthesis associated protein HpnK [Megasphaera sp. UPII 135-E]MUP48161.1 ChbG/HpnK family deacetylase [Veillonellaceae bacterium M2-8]PNH21829.1 hopanoid biosynthesis associated protein HpnK [Megasphaera genomosp. type_2]